MTNEEKALKLSHPDYSENGDLLAYNSHRYEAALEMAAWKDEQKSWHKVSDGDVPNIKPETSIDVLMVVDVYKNSKHKDLIERKVMIGKWFQNYVDQDNKPTGFFSCNCFTENVVAWMELPKFEI